MNTPFGGASDSGASSNAASASNPSAKRRSSSAKYWDIAHRACSDVTSTIENVTSLTSVTVPETALAVLGDRTLRRNGRPRTTYTAAGSPDHLALRPDRGCDGDSGLEGDVGLQS